MRTTVIRYTRHRCTRRHRGYPTWARCTWNRAHWVLGDGPYASVSYCRGTTVVLHQELAKAQAAKVTIDAFGCGGACTRNHRVIQIELPDTTSTRRAA